jgi:hypothetical protein
MLQDLKNDEQHLQTGERKEGVTLNLTYNLIFWVLLARLYLKSIIIGLWKSAGVQVTQ